MVGSDVGVIDGGRPTSDSRPSEPQPVSSMQADRKAAEQHTRLCRHAPRAPFRSACLIAPSPDIRRPCATEGHCRAPPGPVRAADHRLDHRPRRRVHHPDALAAAPDSIATPCAVRLSPLACSSMRTAAPRAAPARPHQVGARHRLAREGWRGATACPPRRPVHARRRLCSRDTRTRAICTSFRAQDRARRQARRRDRHFHRIVRAAGDAQVDRLHCLAGHRQDGGEAPGRCVVVQLRHRQVRRRRPPAPAAARTPAVPRRSRPRRRRHAARCAPPL